MTLIQLDDVGLKFRVRQFCRTNLKDLLLHGILRRSKRPAMEVQALQNINLVVGEGERLGIIGRNGAGKSTLLHLIAGIYPPTSGCRTVVGHISSLFNIALGFEADANGWENIEYRGFLQGETPRSIRAKAKAIAEFSELGDFINMPVRYYSAGMKVRLAFAIATAVEPEILIVDEVLSAGDLNFQAKARERIRTLMTSARAVIVVSHDLKALPLLCEKTLWIDRGRPQMIGPTEQVIAAYKSQADGSQQQRKAA
jgi:ABC-type polysaccharide/polyol phosphate transport system ATPase subunit